MSMHEKNEHEQNKMNENEYLLFLCHIYFDKKYYFSIVL